MKPANIDMIIAMLNYLDGLGIVFTDEDLAREALQDYSLPEFESEVQS